MATHRNRAATFGLILCLSVFASCAGSPQVSTKAIISNMIDTCRAGKNAEAATVMDSATSKVEKHQLKIESIDYSTPTGKKLVDDLCNQLKQEYGNGYEFDKFETGDNGFGWKVLQKGGNEGLMWAFQMESGKYVMAGLDPTRR